MAPEIPSGFGTRCPAKYADEWAAVLRIGRGERAMIPWSREAYRRMRARFRRAAAMNDGRRFTCYQLLDHLVVERM